MNNSRLSRRNRTNKDIGFKSSGGMLDLFDNSFKSSFRLNDDEYDFIAEQITDEEIDVLFKTESLSFSEKRNVLLILEKYMMEFKNK